MLNTSLPVMDDKEGDGVPTKLLPVMDTHVHIFPGQIFQAVWQWFDVHAWRIRYQMTSSDLLEFLLSRGINHIVAMQYAHKPGMARFLNRYMAEKCREFSGKITGLATVFPGEDEAEIILEQAFDLGLKGVKLHAHVQCFEMNSPEMNKLYECCQKHDKPMVMHVSREPKSPAYKCDPYVLCSVDKLETVIKNFPDLKICVPHLGFDEILAYKNLIEKYDNLWLDTAMTITDYFPIYESVPLNQYRSDRIMYGSDFPNIPYAWDRELKVIQKAELSQNSLEKICWHNGAQFFNINKI
ncbi:hypothetical protein SAMN02746065_12038 [Desulfocicer vacuolatum DSM 3385]|uniref:Amidohydrolase-related domain-containing protein n=1 Tax=Desulfocicer vacuolatum DSM 3385 TaxID=1121400 RepID=A0A1W2DU42_9BACT|nr:amidohydrolase family protein [Desulfocicer vacuolatum]SMD00586.1 hypothetical protein SAMN02746065_12038 [Desulfocicer vacuolatum DSM 3385]